MRDAGLEGLSRGASYEVRRDWHEPILSCDMSNLVTWAKAYEAGEDTVSDPIYDYTVKSLVGYRDEFPDLWAKLIIEHPLFASGAWEHTGMFINGK
tara:strand:- start:23299 stop:23586 length:288 start_codon:yes stop_codon:yes gene_type:complete